MNEQQPSYFTQFSTLAMTRSASGVLTLRFHNNQGPASFSGSMQREIPRALYEIGEDSDNRVLVITGTGETFINDIERGSLGDLTKPASWSGIFTRGRSAMQKFVDLEMPIISAVNGPASIHSEWALLADIVVASETATFSDFSHPAFGTVPGDGVALIWEEVLGLNRARYLTLTGGSFTADQGREWGVVGEVVSANQVLTRAQALAEQLAVKPAMLTKFIAVTIRQRLSRRVAEGLQVGMAVEGLAASNKAYEWERGESSKGSRNV